MRRFAPSQPDLFASPVRQADLFPSPPARPPIDELSDMLASLRATNVLPWRTVSAAMQEEHHAINLGQMAGTEGAKLAEAVSEEVERLFAAADARRSIRPAP